MLSDQVAEFESHLFKQMCRLMQIDKIRTIEDRPSTNGMFGRFYRTLNSMIGKVVDDKEKY